VSTLLIYDVAALTLRQQIDLYDWISVRGPETQVISVTSIPLFSLVDNGRFLESLFHRLSVVHILAECESAGALR
jgi:DNA-binding NtrC family response regulator